MAHTQFRSLSKTDLQSLTKVKLHEHMKHLSIREREHQAEVIATVSEVARRRLYFDHGFTSLFDYMTKGLEFPNASAQRYIDAARLCSVVPTLNEDIARGDVNLSQVTVVAKTLRQKSKEEPKFKMETTQATELFAKIKGEDIRASQKIVAHELQIEIKEQELARVQANGSVRHEITLSPEQEALFQRIRELISHVHLNPSFAEVFDYLAKDYQKRKDPLIATGRSTTRSQTQTPDSAQQLKETCEAKKSNTLWNVPEHGDHSLTHNSFHLEVQPRQDRPTPLNGRDPTQRTHIPARTLCEVHRRDRSCRYRDPQTGRPCGSRFQLQADHIQPLWAGGATTLENLQLLCSAHNRLKYRKEAKVQWA